MRATFLILFLALPVSAQDGDTDGDGIIDIFDNCVAVANPSQVDADSDGCGNVCDADYDQNGGVGASDFNILRECVIVQKLADELGPGCEVVDMIDNDGAITAAEVRLFRRLMGEPVGPGVGPCF